MALSELIKFEGDNSSFIWKFPHEDFNCMTELIVHESQEAIFLANGVTSDVLGPGRYKLDSTNIPILTNLLNIVTGTSVFHCEVYFVNKTVQMAVKWGTDTKVRFVEPTYGVPVELGASGEMNLSVSDGKKLLTKLVGTTKGIAWDDDKGGFSKSLQQAFRPMIATAVKSNLAAAIKQRNIDIVEVDEHLEELSEDLKDKILPGFWEFGLTIPQFYLSNVVLPETDPNFKKLRELHTINLAKRFAAADAERKKAEVAADASVQMASAEANAKVIAAQREAVLEEQTTKTEIAKKDAERQIIQAQVKAQEKQILGQADAAVMEFTGQAEAEVMKMKGYTQKDAFRVEVQKAYAEGLGNMGPSGGGSVVGDMVGLGVGLSAARAIVPQFSGMMDGIGLQEKEEEDNAAGPGGWKCSCGNTVRIGLFCNMCGARKPTPLQESWDCPCGNKGIIGLFCNMCGAKKPEGTNESWDCSCGNKGIVGNFCNMCGKKRE